MAPKTLKKFCKLSKYLEQKDRDLYQVFDDLCIMHYLRPDRAGGITLLFPKEKAYRQEIINAAYSDNPDKAVNMLKSIILPKHYPSPASMKGGPVNLLKQSIEVIEAGDKEVKVKPDMVLKKDDAFATMGNRDNMAVYFITGKGRIPLDRPAVKETQTAPVKGGGCSMPSVKKRMQKMVADKFTNGRNDVYAKKVTWQLGYLKKENVPEDKIRSYLGNDDITDSYLLDMLCDKDYPHIFQELLNSMEAILSDKSLDDVDPPLYDEAVTDGKIPDPHPYYIKMKSKFTLSDGNVHHMRFPERLKGIESPMDIRQRVHELYKNDKHSLGRDLFIVFCNIHRDLWHSSPDWKDIFSNFTYLVVNVYTKPTDMLNQEFDVARDLTLYGNLLKSDVFMFSPEAVYRKRELPIPPAVPSPLDMNMYSLCGYVKSLRLYHIVPKGGAESSMTAEEIRAMLSDE